MPACVQGCQLQHQNNPDLLMIDKVEEWSSSHANFSVPREQPPSTGAARAAAMLVMWVVINSRTPE
jgi:hypothetical protein